MNNVIMIIIIMTLTVSKWTVWKKDINICVFYKLFCLGCLILERKFNKVINLLSFNWSSGIRTHYLKVMSLASYHCSTSQK